MVFDHEGKIYEDVGAMCAAYNINPGTHSLAELEAAAIGIWNRLFLHQ